MIIDQHYAGVCVYPPGDTIRARDREENQPSVGVTAEESVNLYRPHTEPDAE
jgi:hypothetical protein